MEGGREGGREEGTHVPGQSVSEGSARHRSLRHHLQSPLGQTDGPHAVVDPPRPQPPLSNLKSPPLSQDQVTGRNTDVVKLHLHVAVRCIWKQEERG